MRVSTFWNKMKIFTKDRKNVDVNELYISQELPEFSVRNDYTKKREYNSIEIKELSNFYRYNFRIGKSNNSIFVPESDLTNILNMKGEVITIYKDNILVGSIISYEIPVAINKKINIPNVITNFDNIKNKHDDVIFGCTTGLILQKKFRGTGLGIILIQESLQRMYETGIKAAYFINNVSRCSNSIPIINWYYPLNLDKLDKCHYLYPREFRNRFSVEGSNMSMIVNSDNAIMAHDFYTRYVKEKLFYFSPSIEYYQKWIKRFETYVVLENSRITGLFTFNHVSIWYPSLNAVLEIGYLITCIGEDIDFTIEQVLLQGKNSFDLIIFHELGDIKSKNLEKIFAQRNFKSYINFFNTPVQLSHADFYAPVL